MSLALLLISLPKLKSKGRKQQDGNNIATLRTKAISMIYGRHARLTRSAILFLALTCFGKVAGAQENIKPAIPAKDFTTRIWLGSQLLPGYGQIANRQYWKLPVLYGGMGSMIYLGVKANQTYLSRLSAYNSLTSTDPNRELYKERMVKQRQTRNLYIAAAGAFYVAGAMDAVLVYNNSKHSPAAATILSSLVPGMGQAYNQKYWKIPVVYGGLATLYYLVSWNDRYYSRFKTALKLNIDGDDTTVDEFGGARTADELRYYMDSYRRNRDLSILGLTAIYIINILDANVDGFLHDWNVDDNLSFRVEPAIVNPALTATADTHSALGLSCRVTF